MVIRFIGQLLYQARARWPPPKVLRPTVATMRWAKLAGPVELIVTFLLSGLAGPV